jgi:hypothetical protein
MTRIDQSLRPTKTTFSLTALLAPVIPNLVAQAGKDALARAPIVALPPEVVTRAKTGFGVPTAVWMNAATKTGPFAGRGRAFEAKGLTSRRWSQAVLHGFA